MGFLAKGHKWYTEWHSFMFHLQCSEIAFETNETQEGDIGNVSFYSIQLDLAGIHLK